MFLLTWAKTCATALPKAGQYATGGAGCTGCRLWCLGTGIEYEVEDFATRLGALHNRVYNKVARSKFVEVADILRLSALLGISVDAADF